MGERSRLTIDLEPELHRQLKVLAARRGTSMREICIEAIRLHIANQGRPLILKHDDPLAELWDNEYDAIYDNL